MVRCCTIKCCNNDYNDYKCCNYKCHNYCDYLNFNEFCMTEKCITEYDNNDDNFCSCIICIVGTPIAMALDLISCPFRCFYYSYKECYCIKIKNTITQQPPPQPHTQQPKKKQNIVQFNDRPPNYNQHHKDCLVVSPPEPLPPIYTY